MSDIRAIIHEAVQQSAAAMNAKPVDLCVVGRPSCVRELRKIGITAHAVPGIPEYVIGENRFMSDIHVIFRRDLWIWRGRGMRAKLLRMP